MKRWYTLYAKPNAEYQVQRTLQQHGIQTYLPEFEKRNERREVKREPFFPCYLFMRVDLTQINLSLLQWTPGLRYIVGFDGHPMPLADEVVDLVRQKLDELKAAGGQKKRPYQPGDTVRITKGPFQDMLAIFEGPTTPSRRVEVLLTFLGRASRTRVDETDIEKAPPGAEAPKPKRPRRTRGRGRRIKH